MDLVDPDVDRYLHELSRSDDPVLLEMERLAEERGFPIVGPQVGRLLDVLVRGTGTRRALELGSGFGYSAYWIARAMGPDGLVVLTESSAELAAEARAFLARGGLEGRARIEVGDALEIAAGLDETFDLVLNDVDKEDYGRVVEVARARLRLGGLLVSDNMLWYGRVLAVEPGDAATRGVLELTRRLREADDFSTSVVPVRDGVALSVRTR